jgi:hypothetical protein
MPGSNPHRLNSRAENEIENGKEPPPKYIEEGSGPRKQGKHKKEAPIRTEKSKNVPTLKQQAKPRVQEHGRHGQSGAERPALSSSDDESFGRKHRDDQQRRRREQDQKTGRNREKKGNQTQMRDGFNNENRSLNTSSAGPTCRSSQNLPTHFTSQMNIPPQYGTTQAWSPQTTSAPNSLRQVLDASLQFGTAQAHGRGIQRKIPRTGGAYSSAQSPGYAQQTSKRS